MEEGMNAFKILMGKHTGKTPLGRPRHRWADNISMDLKETGITRNSVDWVQDRDYWRTLVNAELNFWIAQVMKLIIHNLFNILKMQIVISLCSMPIQNFRV
jgi:hypothetical protein